MKAQILLCIIFALTAVSADSNMPQDTREWLKFGNEFLLGFSHVVNVPI